jgi:cystathionine gamma-synthase
MNSLVINPCGKHYTKLKSYLQNSFEDVWYHADAIVMDKNSRDFASRARIIDDNTLAAAQLFHSSPLISKVCYPYYETRELYEACRKPGAGYGGLVSLIFKSAAASKAFYDRLTCAKGPTLGTNFTLACFYTILGHYHELEWVESLGVDAALVRISVGMENKEMILGMFKEALKAAENVADFTPVPTRTPGRSDH